jgi:uncharacterized protein
MASSNTPTLEKERYQALDILRGFAILGILIMNIQSFAMPGPAYLNPTAYGDLTGINYWAWIISHVIADQKFMTIFSILYGAGIVLVTSRAEEKTGKSAGLHYKRTFWLLIIGLIHAHLIWYGDILVAYALCALVLFPLRKMRPSRQLGLGIFLFSIHSLIYLFFGSTIQYWPAETIAEMADFWAPGMESIQHEIAMVTGTFSQQIQHNSSSAIELETTVFLLLMFWRISGLMLIGMSLYKKGFLLAKKTVAHYRKIALIVFPVGLTLVIFGVIKNFEANWDLTYSMFLGSQFNYWGSLLISIGYISLIMLLAKSSVFSSLKDRLAAIGQMALTNYISQSIIGALLFFGIGFSLFGQIERWLQVVIVLAVWILQLIWSKPWLNSYRFGPLEWVWRSLTYGKKQLLRKK